MPRSVSYYSPPGCVSPDTGKCRREDHRKLTTTIGRRQLRIKFTNNFLEREKALNDLRASVTGLAMTATAKLLSEQAGPESDKKRYQAFLASAGEKHD